MPNEKRLAEVRARAAAATKGPWEHCPNYGPQFYAYLGGSHLQGVGDLNFGVGDQAEADLAFALAARDDVDWLLERVAELEATLERYVGREPTVAEEMAYLNRCLNAVHDLCREAEKQATRWEHPLPVPEWVSAVREAAGPENRLEDEVAQLRKLLADRDREIAELKAAEPTLDDDQPGVPA
ncbi:hypothetical protein ACFWIB_14420 [Streptomyces sp. NPDC127051]|uniref:hypothetical protein n=1 Tax=Streptomyces sp. NPDC127051 TaxID=3347119 RepID=UPI0036468D3A